MPDPTVLTTEQLLREIARLEKLMEASISGLRAVVNEQFESVDKQFQLVERQRVEQKKDCVWSGTPILCADLVWRRAGELQVGDELVALDDEAVYEPGHRTPRRFRRGVVTANSIEPDELLRVVTQRGELLCNSHHPLLARRGRVVWNWVRARDLRAGDMVMHAVDVWEAADTWEAGWLAGILDGEGCLHFHGSNGDRNLARVSITQREGATADRIEGAVAATVGAYAVHPKKVPKEHHAPQKVFQIDQRAEVMRMLGSIRPPRLMENAHLAWEGQSIGGRGRATQVDAVESAGEGTVAMLSVSTGTYIAAGFASHNTKDAVDAALAAAKEAVKEQTTASGLSITKSETATTEQLKQLTATFTTAINAVTATINDLKEQVVRIESLKQGGKETVTGIYALAGLGLTGLSVVFAAYIATH